MERIGVFIDFDDSVLIYAVDRAVRPVPDHFTSLHRDGTISLLNLYDLSKSGCFQNSVYFRTGVNEADIRELLFHAQN